MHVIAHRRNTVAQLLQTPRAHGVEVDIRTAGTRLLIHHDPFVDGEDFEVWISHYEHGTLILNVKEEGLEQRLIEIMGRHGIDDFFFLDQSFPFLVKTASSGERRCAVRVSEFEAVETALSLAGRIDWVWVDCFTQFPLSAERGHELCDAGFRLCIVSPELQGRDAEREIPALRTLLRERGITAAAVCTKRPDLWAA